jgi:hypothetical protein
MARLLDIEIEEARFLSLLSGDPVLVKDDIYIWNGVLVNRAAALVALLRIYCQLPVNNYLKTTLFRGYSIKFREVDEKYLLKNTLDDRYQIGEQGVWFYELCGRIKGNIDHRSEQDIKRLMILLHS